TDPLRLLFIWLFLVQPIQALIIYIVYVLLGSLVWIKTGRQDPIWLLPIFPFYRLVERLCRLFDQFYWLKIKYEYVFKKNLHLLVKGRKLRLEYSGVLLIILFIWSLSIYKLFNTVLP